MRKYFILIFLLAGCVEVGNTVESATLEQIEVLTLRIEALEKTQARQLYLYDGDGVKRKEVVGVEEGQYALTLFEGLFFE